MAEKTLELSVESTSLQVKVERATVLIGMRRTRLKSEALQEKDLDRKLLRMYTYADSAACSSGTLTIDGKVLAWPCDFETFLNLPDELIGPVEELVYLVNPHWLPQEEGAEVEKKAPTVSTSG